MSQFEELKAQILNLTREDFSKLRNWLLQLDHEQFTNGHGNYTQERQAFVDQLSLDEILEQIKQTQPSPKLAKPGPNSQAES